MFRLVFMTFFGPTRVGAELQPHIHEPPASMSVVLGVLAFGSVVAGFIGLPQLWREWLGLPAPFHDFLGPVLGHFTPREGVSHRTELLLMLVAIAVALAGIALAWRVYGRRPQDALARSPGALRTLVSRGYYFDAFYAGVIVRTLGWLSATVLARTVEPALARGMAQPGRSGPALSRWLARLQSGDLQAYLLYALAGLALVLVWGAAHA
jgi:NADH-quinone oxidoreductase subunit L